MIVESRKPSQRGALSLMCIPQKSWNNISDIQGIPVFCNFRISIPPISWFKKNHKYFQYFFLLILRNWDVFFVVLLIAIWWILMLPIPFSIGKAQKLDFWKLLDPFWDFSLKTVCGIHDSLISWLPFGTNNHEMFCQFWRRIIRRS